MSSEGLVMRYILVPQELGNSRRKKMKTTLSPGVREEQEGEEAEDWALLQDGVAVGECHRSAAWALGL